MRHLRAKGTGDRTGRSGRRRGFALVGAATAALLLAGCAGSPRRASPLPGFERRGYDGVVLQEGAVSPEGVVPPGKIIRREGVSPLSVLWFPVRLTYGLIGFALAGDAGPIPFTGFRFLSGATSPWFLASGEFFVGEDAYDPDEWPDRGRRVLGNRGPDPELLPGYTDP